MTLLIMAAGMGSRYGGLKQIESVGEYGELIIDYSVYDALKAGFDKVVFVIRREIEGIFCKKFFDRISKRINASYVFQETPTWRDKPFGTTAAVLAAKRVIAEPFCLINADDWYGAAAFEKVHDFFAANDKSDDECGVESECTSGGEYNAIVAYDLASTVSDFGQVSRGILITDGDKNVIDIKETKLSKHDAIAAGTLANMNCFGFTPKIFRFLDEIFREFRYSNGQGKTAECYLSENVGRLIKEGKIKMKTLKSDDTWMGFTYPQDKKFVTDRIKEMIARGVYPSPLWN